jgi:hypothetical protein
MRLDMEGHGARGDGDSLVLTRSKVAKCGAVQYSTAQYNAIQCSTCCVIFCNIISRLKLHDSEDGQGG